MKKLFLLLAAVIISVSCTREALSPRQQDEIAVLNKAKEFFGAVSRRDFGRVWDMSTPLNKDDALKAGVTRDAYAEKMGKFTWDITLTDADSLKLVIVGQKYAITQADVTYEITEDSKARSTMYCERIFWLKFPEGWYWHQIGMTCDYMPGADEIERLTSELR